MSSTDYSGSGLLLNLLESDMGAPAFNDSAIAFPTNWYVGASVSTPRFFKGASPLWGFTEPSDFAYVRQEAAFVPAPTQPSGAYAMAPTAAVTFPAATTNWGSVTYLGLFDSAASGNLWFYVPLVRTVTDGVIQAGSATLTSATAAFTSGDVGTGIYCSGVPVGTTILSVSSATTVVFSAAASVSATGVALAISTPIAVGATDTLSVSNLKFLLA
ncbi:MAG TPA: hypothetical protein VMW80_14310 [Candidatus Dormibacteraeota bacterium]|nr:hypothetical protein [Candidatus Dormibacteraeota bacterium]